MVFKFQTLPLHWLNPFNIVCTSYYRNGSVISAAISGGHQKLWGKHFLNSTSLGVFTSCLWNHKRGTFLTDFFSTFTCTCIFLFIFILQITYWYVGWFVYAMKKGTYKAGWLCSLPQENSPDHRQVKSCYFPQWYTLTVWNISSYGTFLCL